MSAVRHHAAVERAIRDSGLDYTFLRPHLYMQALLALAPSIKAGANPRAFAAFAREYAAAFS
jgi:uncharacterized protein YbjT (DUF2867 family)